MDRNAYQQVDERAGKFHVSASLPWCLFGLYGPDRMPETGKEADVICRDVTHVCLDQCNREAAESRINAFANDL